MTTLQGRAITKKARDMYARVIKQEHAYGMGTSCCKHCHGAGIIQHQMDMPKIAVLRRQYDFAPRKAMAVLKKAPRRGSGTSGGKRMRITRPRTKAMGRGTSGGKRMTRKTRKTTNPWLVFLKQFHNKHPNLSYREAMMEAKKHY